MSGKKLNKAQDAIVPGYKKTLVGWMPNDWTIERLKACANVIFSNVDKHIVAGEKEVYLCNYTDVYKNTYIFGGINFSKGTVKEPEFLKFRLKKGDVVITKDSEDRTDIAVPAFVIENVPDLVCGYHLAVIRPKSSVLDGLFLYYALSSYNVNHYFQRRANGITRFGLDTETVRSSFIPVPPFQEQKAIAALFATWDKAIMTITSLIGQKELDKKWLIQQLLTGRKRLKGFRGKWKQVNLGDVTKKISRRNKTLVDAKVYSVTNFKGFVLQSDHFEREVSGDNLTNHKIIKRNEFAYNPARINVGSIAFFGHSIGVISSLYVCFSTTKDILDYYLLQLFELDLIKHRISSYGEGGVRIYLWYELFSKIRILLPSIEEQTALVSIFQNRDQEIQLLEANLEKLKEQKKGLMQELLSGKVRVNKLTN